VNGLGGVQLLVEESRDLPIVRLGVSLRTGGADDPAELDGLANFTTELMARGAAGKSRAVLDAAFDALGSDLSIQTDFDGAHLELTVLRDRLDEAAALLADVVLRPEFPVDEADKLRREIEAQLDELRDDDAALARRFLGRRLFGAHAYGRTVTGTEATLPALDAAAARAWHARAVRGPGAVIGVCGDLDAAGAAALVERHFAALPIGGSARFGERRPRPAERRGTRLTIVDKPERSQSQIQFAQLGPDCHGPDFDPFSVAIHAFGGTFSSRLMDEVRSKRGLSYGASARIGSGRGARGFVVGVFPSLEQTAETVALVRELLRELARAGQPDEVIEFGRHNLIESFAFSQATPEDRLDHRIGAELSGQPPDHVARFAQRMGAVSPSAANEVTRRLLRPDDLEIVIVATADEVLPRLEAARLLTDFTVEIAAYDRD
jgi:zinc protease